MAVSVRSTSAAVRPSAASHTVTLPSGVQSGDVLIVAFACDNVTGGGNYPATTSSGWFRLATQQQGAGTNIAASLFWKRATGSNTLVVTHTAQEAAYVAVAVQDDAGEDPIVAATNVNAVPVTFAPVTVTSGNYLSLLFAGLDANPPTDRTLTPPTTPVQYSNLDDAEPTTGSAVGMYAMVGDDLVAASTSIAPGSVAVAGLTAAEQWISFNVAIADPAPVATAPTVDAGADVSVGVDTYVEWTATFSDNGSTITASEWEILSGPAYVGAIIDDEGDGDIGFTGQIPGDYVFQYSATNEAGTSSDTMTLTVTADPPGSVFDLSRWKVTRPIDGGDAGTAADEVTQPALDDLQDSNFYLNGSDKMVMIAPAQGATTSGSGGTRYEFREMEDGDEADWDFATTGYRRLTFTGTADATSIVGGTQPRQETIVGQIHGESGTPPIYLAVQYTSGTAGTPVVPPRLQMFRDQDEPGGSVTVLDGLSPTTEFTYRVLINGGRLKLWAEIGTVDDLPSSPRYDLAASAFTDNTGCYFKAGPYNKSLAANDNDGASIVTVSHLELLQPGDAPPPVTGTVAIAAGAPTLAVAGTAVAEVVTGTVAIAIGAPTLTAAGTMIAEVVTGAVSLAVGAPGLAVDGTVVHEVVTGSVAVELGAPALTVAGTAVAEVVTGAVVMTVGAPTLGVIGTSIPEVVTGTVALELAAPELTATGTAAPPITGDAVRFDEASDRVTYAGAMPDPVDGFTATWWAYLSVDRNDYSAFFRLWANGSTTATIETIDNGTSPGYFTAGGSVLSLTPMTVGVWHRIAVTATGTTAHVYSAAGAAGATDHASGTIGGSANPNGITVGGRHPDDATESFNGRLACLRIWDRVLTQTEIEAEWESWTPVADEPWANWLLDDATDLRDWSGNGRHLVAGTTPVTEEDGPPIAGAPPMVVTGSVSLAVEAPTVTSAGIVVAEVVTGAVTLVASAPTLVAAGTVVHEVVTGSVALAVPAPTITAAGTAIAQVVTGSVALDVGAPALVATGTAASEIVTGSVSLAVAAPTVTATGIVVHEIITGTVHVTVGAPVVTATGFRVVDGVVEIDLGPLTLTVEGLAFDPDARPPALHAGTPVVGVGLRAGEPITLRLLVGTPTVTSLRAGTPTVTRLRAGAPITA